MRRTLSLSTSILALVCCSASTVLVVISTQLTTILSNINGMRTVIFWLLMLFCTLPAFAQQGGVSYDSSSVQSRHITGDRLNG